MYYDENDANILIGEAAVEGGDYHGEFQKVNSVVMDERCGVSAVAFDLHEELVWVGNQGGHVTSFYGQTMEKYTSFKVHPTEEIRAIVPFDEVMLFLSQTQLRGQIRRGLPSFNHVSENMQAMQCMISTDPARVLMGGHQNQMIEYDLPTQREIRLMHLPNESTCAILRAQHQNRYILAGDPSGHICLMDNRTLKVEHGIDAHNGSLSDFDVHGNLMVTCGFSARQGNLSVDRFIKVYDIRALRAMAPIQLSIDPLLLRFLPSFSSRIAAVSSNGQMEILETQAVSQANICIYQVASSPSAQSTSFDVSSSCHHMSFGDSSGYVTLFSAPNTSMFNVYSRETEFPDPPPEPVNIENSFLAQIPLYYGTTELLSDWPPELTERIYRKTPPINQTILNSMKMVGTIGYAPNPGLFRRNQVTYKMNEYKQTWRTNIVGWMETSSIRINMTSSIGVSGVGNFLRVFRMVPEASALGLILNDNMKNKGCLLRIIQNWNRFILHHIEGELGKQGDPISKLFAMKQENMNRCTKCGREEKKQSTVLLSNLLYSSDGNGKRLKFIELLQRSLCPEQTTPAWCERCEKYQPTFQCRVPTALPPILSLNTCLDNTHDFQQWKSGLEASLKSETVMSTGLKPCRYGRACNRADCKFWHEDSENNGAAGVTEFDQNPDFQVSWLPTDLQIVLEESSVRVIEATTENSDYELFAVVVFVKDENEEKCNVASIVKINGEWNLFNDFMVRQIKTIEAISCNPKWKIPAIVYYRKKQLPPPPTPIKNKIPMEVFKHNAKQKYKTLTRDEHLQLVALDAEFVTLGQEETELRSDGKLATIKPQQLSVARVTVIRENGSPLMDDYVSTQEVIVDYLTKFSGIQPGDLDANYSSKNVTSLKIVYSKLCYMIEQGVKFVGHGINNDFRVINLVVPADQIIDTVTLFHFPNQRMVSLRFLAWHYLGMNIQTEVHDSLEDARAALYLYRKYEELKKKGKLEKSLEEMYEKGKKLNWKVQA
ncbi:unnamed protein product [Allacma fusca]|uniref:USP domain-containing protein n=1 Tax=Allacma fusca TaxID=39272 RepID=A0A8J2J6N0_9HEXA|nr:unnamed protein product [Allacma fusca]